MYQIGTLVEHKLSGTIGVVVNKSDADKKYWIKFSPITEPRLFTSGDIQPITFKQYAWYQDPNTGKYKIGGNGAFPVVLLCLMGLLFMGLSFTVEGWWMLAPLGIGAAIIVVNYLGLRYNYTKRWV